MSHNSHGWRDKQINHGSRSIQSMVKPAKWVKKLCLRIWDKEIKTHIRTKLTLGFLSNLQYQKRLIFTHCFMYVCMIMRILYTQLQPHLFPPTANHPDSTTEPSSGTKLNSWFQNMFSTTPQNVLVASKGHPKNIQKYSVMETSWTRTCCRLCATICRLTNGRHGVCYCRLATWLWWRLRTSKTRLRLCWNHQTNASLRRCALASSRYSTRICTKPWISWRCATPWMMMTWRSWWQTLPWSWRRTRSTFTVATSAGYWSRMCRGGTPSHGARSSMNILA